MRISAILVAILSATSIASAAPIFIDDFMRGTLPAWNAAQLENVISVDGNNLVMGANGTAIVHSPLINAEGLSGLTYSTNGTSFSIESDSLNLEVNTGDGSGWTNLFNLVNGSNDPWVRSGNITPGIFMLRFVQSGNTTNDTYSIDRLELDATGTPGTAASLIYSDQATGTPASAGWAVVIDPDAGDGDNGGSGSVVSDGNLYDFTRTGPVDRVLTRIEQTIDTTGYENIYVEFTGRVGTGQGPDGLSVEYNAGSGWQSLFSGRNQSFDILSVLSADADENSSLMLRATLNANNIETAELNLFNVWGFSTTFVIPEPTSASLLALAGLAVMRSRRQRA